MLGCQCQSGLQQPGFPQDPGTLALFEAIRGLPQGSDTNLAFFVQGVKVGMQIRAAENQKWTKLGVIMALAFGVLTLIDRMDR